MRGLRKALGWLALLSFLIGQPALALPSVAVQTAATANKQDTNVMFEFGQSQIPGARNDYTTELPASYCSTLDSKFFIWDTYSAHKIVTLTFGPMERQPDPNLIDIAYTNTIGPHCEFAKWLRASGDTAAYTAFIYAVGGSRFTDAGGNARKGNWTTNLSDGARAGLERQWEMFKSALALKGMKPKVVFARTDLGYSSGSDPTEAANYQTDMTGLINVFRANMIGRAPLFIERASTQVTAGGFANIPTVRTAQQNIAASGSPNRLINTDGMPTETAIDNIHFTAPSFVALGNALLNEYKGYWYPQKEWSYLGGCPVAREWRMGDLRNTYTTTVSSAWDASGNNKPLAFGGGLQPTIATTTLSNGYTARYATGDGVDDVGVNTTRFMMNGSESWGIFSAFSAPAVNGANVFGEASSAAGNPVMLPLRSDASGNLTFLYRDDAATVYGPTTLQSGAFNSTMNFVATWDTGSAFQGNVNGTSGSSVGYTRGTATTNQVSAYELTYNLGTLGPSAAKVGIIWAVDGCTPDATYLANARAFTQREYGTQ